MEDFAHLFKSHKQANLLFMKKKFIMSLLFSSLFFSLKTYSKEGVKKYCTISQLEKQSVFKCLETEHGNTFTLKYAPLFEDGVQEALEKSGHIFLKLDEYCAIADNIISKEPKKSGEVSPPCLEKGHEVAEVPELKNRDLENEITARFRKVASLLKKNGVCNMSIDTTDSHNRDYGVIDNDELLKHMLCIANKESALGQQNRGKGGRGLYGINPKTNRTVCQKKELNDQDQNTECALKLFELNQLADWGFTELQSKNNKWGANRYCTVKIKEKFNFLEILGDDVCCSEKCKKL